MQYPVPQFDDVEDKVIGPLSFRQFVYVAGGAGLCYALYRALPTGLNILAVLPVAGFSFALAFYKINNQPFITVLESAFYYSIKNKLYLWAHNRKKKKTPQAAAKQLGVEAPVDMPSMSNSKMKDLAWSLDINERIDRVREDTSTGRAAQVHHIAEKNVLSTI